MTSSTNARRRSRKIQKRASFRRFGSLRQLYQSEEGLFTLLQCLVAGMFAGLCLLLLHVGTAVDDKMQAQNVVDSAARSASVCIARCLNAISTINHVAGEMTGMMAAREAVAGGPGVPRSKKHVGDANRAKIRIDLAHVNLLYRISNPPPHVSKYEMPAYVAAAARALPFAYSKVGREIEDGATVLVAKTRLMEELTDVYNKKHEALSTKNYGAIEPLNQREQKILDEWEILQRLANRAASLLPQCEILTNQVLPDLQRTAFDAKQLAERDAREAADRAAQQIDGGRIEFLKAKAPLIPDPLATAHDLSPIPEAEWYGPNLPTANYDRPSNVDLVDVDRKQIVKITQLARASYPWAIYHGEPVRKFIARNCPISQPADTYGEQLTVATIRQCDDLQKKGAFVPYVLENATLPDKGYEKWTDDPADADSHFAVFCVLTYGPNPLPQPEGMKVANGDDRRCAYAQAIVYNANPQQRNPKRIDLTSKRIVPDRQPAVGWDTLQWDTSKATPFETTMKGTFEPLRRDLPLVNINWQAKLTPVSASVMAAHPGVIKNAVGDAWPLTPVSPALLTH